MPPSSDPVHGQDELLRAVSVQVLTSRRQELGREWAFDLCSPFWRIYVNNRSGAWIIHQDRRHQLGPGGLWVIPAWVRFQTGLNRTVRQDFLHFHLTGLPPTLLRTIFPHPILLSPTPVLRALTHHWGGGFGSDAPFTHACHAGALAQHAVAEMFARADGPHQGSSLAWLAESHGLQPALQAIDRHLSEPLANPDLARLCGLGEDHFIRKFRQVIGLTPARYGMERRLTLAAEWLTTTRRTLEEISTAAGFTDRFHFSRAFKARLGVPPATYRRLHILPANP